MKRSKSDEDECDPPRRKGRKHISVDGIDIELEEGDDTPCEYVTMAQVSYDMGECGNECWGCQNFCKPDNPEKEKELARLWEFYEEKKGCLNDDALCEHMSQLHHELIEKPLLEAGVECLAWPKRMVHLHFNIHRVTALNMVKEDIRTVRDLKKLVERRLVRRNPVTQEEEPVLAMIKAWRDLRKDQMELLSTNVDKLITL